MSMDKSRNDSSRDETVSHVRQRVSLVSTPSKRRWTKVDEFVGWEVETVMVLGAGAPVDELRDDIDWETSHRKVSSHE